MTSLTRFTPFSSVSIVDFKQVNACWAVKPYQKLCKLKFCKNLQIFSAVYGSHGLVSFIVVNIGSELQLY